MAVSAELQAIKDMLMQGKLAGDPEALVPAEQMVAVREGNDQMLSAFPLPEDMELAESPIDQPGEFYAYTGTDKQEGKLLLYFHGGGYENGTVASRRFIAMGITSAAHVDCFSFDYTQWPEGKHPQALEEAAACWDAVESAYGAENIWQAGESAGTMLGLSLCHWLKDKGRKLPAKILSIGPVLDVDDGYPSREANEEVDPMFWCNIGHTLRYFEDADLASPFVSPGCGDFAGFPPTMVTVGTEEVLYDDAADLHAKLDDAGVENTFRVYEGCFHTFQCLPSPEAYASIAEMGAFLRS